MNDTPAYIDRFDEPIIERLEEGKAYKSNQIIRAYKTYTEITNHSTAEQRKNNLFESPCMEFTGKPGVFEYVGLQEAMIL